MEKELTWKAKRNKKVNQLHLRHLRRLWDRPGKVQCCLYSGASGFSFKSVCIIQLENRWTYFD